MKKLILTLFIIMLPVMCFAAKDKVLVVEVRSDGEVGYSNQQISSDYGRIQLSAVFQMIELAGLDYQHVMWDCDTTNLKRHTYYNNTNEASSNYGFRDDYICAIFVGGIQSDFSSNSYIFPGGEGCSGEIGRWALPDTTVNKLNSIFWFGYRAFSDTSSIKWGTDEAEETVNDNVHGFLTSNYSGTLDTLFVYQTKFASKIAPIDSSEMADVTKVLESSGWSSGDDNPTTGHLAAWERTDDGVTNHYLTLRHGTASMLIYAWIMKYATNYEKIQWALDMDDWNYPSNAGGSAFPSSSHLWTQTNFWDRLDLLCALIESYDMKMSIGGQWRYVRNAANSYADSSQYSKWITLTDKYRNNNNFQWTIHEAPYLFTDQDSTTILFNGPGSTAGDYSDINAAGGYGFGDGTPPTVEVIDSLYNVAVDSAETWGVTIADYIQPPNDDINGHYDDLKDTIATWAAQNGITYRFKYSHGSLDDFHDSQIYLGANILAEHYITLSDTTAYTQEERGEDVYQRIIEPICFGSNYFDGQNPNVYDEGLVYSSTRTLSSNQCNPSYARVLILHIGSSKLNNGTSCNEQMINDWGELINYFETIAGKDLFECRFAQDIDWEQIQ